jgi:spermidine synthase
MKDFIYNEMMVHVGVCTNKNPQKVLLVSNDAAGFEAEMKKHDAIAYDVIPATLEALRDVADASVDVIITESNADAAILAHYNRVLQEDGLLVTTITSLDNVDENKQIMSILSNYTKVIMPFHVGEGKMALLASKEYHPTADIILQRADMLDDLEYYNCDVHPAAFAMGNYIRKEYLGIIKN